MEHSVPRTIVAVAATIALAAACEQTSPVSPSFEAPTLAAAVSIPTTGLNEAVWVCKDAPSGSFDFTVTATITQTGTTVNVIDAAPTIAAGQCVKVADAGNGNSITVTELAATGYTFDHIDAYEVPHGTNSLVADAANPIASPTVTRNFGDVGRVFVFFNTENPPPPPPPSGCTYTQGYWKTHSEKGPAPYDDTWAQLANGADTDFFLSGQTWYEVFNTAPAGNAYYNLAHQYMAAVLNGLSGADPSAVSSALTDAAALFNTYTPADIGALRGNDSVRKQFIALAEILDDYNTGAIGPGHCSDGSID